MYQNKRYVFKYDAQDNLKEYIEYDEHQRLKYAYHFDNCVLKKIYCNHEEDGEIYREMKSIIEYPPGCVMHHTVFDGVSRVVVRKPNGDYVSPIKRIEKCDGKFTGYSIKKELLNKWIKQLNHEKNILNAT